MQAVLIYITAANREEAILLSHELLGRKLVACANLVEHVASLYWWDGEIEQNNEVVIIVKTVASLVDDVTKAVKAAHSYECPAIVSIPITGGNADYIEWIRKQVRFPEPKN